RFYAAWSDFLTPVAPPIICVDPGGSEVSSTGAAPLASAVRALGAARREGRGVRDAEAELTTQTDMFTSGQEAHEGTFFVGYNLGVAGVQNRQAQISVRELARVAERFSPEYMPSLTRSGALARVRQRGIDPTDVTRTFLGRYLTGLAKLRRSEVTEDAIIDFRYAINAINYMHPDRTMPPGGSAAEISVPLYVDWVCDSSSSRERLTSLHAYAGLIAAYLASPAYQNPTPGALAREMVRAPNEMDPTDPLREIILYGQRAASSGTRVVPENFLWAASNLQRLLHINRLSVSKPLLAARTVLGLQIVSRPTWVEALSAQQGFTACRFLLRAWDDLDYFGRTFWAMDLDQLSPTDQVLAALAVYVVASSYDHCDDPIEPGPEARAGLLRAGIPHLSDVLPGLYEQRRLVLESSTTYGPEIDGILDELAVEQAMFSRDQAPPHIEQSYDLVDAAEFASNWRQALFLDVSSALAAEGVAGRGQAPGRTTPGEFLIGLEEAILLAGIRPSEVYEWTAFRDMALRVSVPFERGMAYRYRARSRPELHWAILVVGTASAVLSLMWLLLFWWRWRLIAGVQYPRERQSWEDGRGKTARA
ncbi:MAG: hypothetical protein O6851_09980, partial [Gemmatimonadetes bacterium]|nr:hypothetical protein [Gemmatimonadota bacterium]